MYSYEFSDGSNVKISLKHKNRLVLGDRVECVFWDFDHKKWSSLGCHLLDILPGTSYNRLFPFGIKKGALSDVKQDY
ncbi:unnamed protein product [Oppiella nova]|uniref:Uncharacterized protein n=1 Tax=Oppiella nova TaxID=334625 RepID=A0A7R9LPZ3_9ACAR|nr:unnamed protein product [Oppiella nova]CAG2165779.1 unnamed protein product [Oppiella nova]